MSLIAMLALGASVAQAPLPQAAPNIGVQISYETVAVPVTRALEEIAQSAGVSLKAAPALSDPIVVIRVQDAPLSELMDRLAKVCSAEWKLSQGTYWLQPSPAIRRREESDRLKKRAAALREAIAARSRDPSSSDVLTRPGQASELRDTVPDEEEVEYEPSQARWRSAQDLFFTKLLESLDVGLLASLPETGRVVFSTRPTAMQRPMPMDIGPLVDALIASYNEMALSTPTEPSPLDERERKWRERLEEFHGKEAPLKPVADRPSKAIVGVTGDGWAWNLELKLYDGKGRDMLVATSYLRVEDPSQMTSAQGTSDEFGEVEQRAAKGHPIALSPESKLLLEFFNRLEQQADFQMSPELAALLSRPDQRDPQSFFESDALLSLAKLRAVQLVANLPDNFGAFGRDFSTGYLHATVEQFELSLNGALRTESAGGWLTVQPLDPVKAREARADRGAMAKLIASARAKGMASLADLAEFASQAPASASFEWPAGFLFLFVPEVWQYGGNGEGGLDMFRLYGTFNRAELDALERGESVALGALTPQQRAIVSRMLFFDEPDLVVRDPGEPAEVREFRFDWLDSPSRKSKGDYREEPTEIMPSGLPNSGTLTLSQTTETAGLAVGPNLPSWINTMLDAETLGFMKYFEESYADRMGQAKSPKVEGLRLGTRRTLRFSFTVAPGVTLERSLFDNRADPNAPVVPMSELPEEFKNRIAQCVASIKKRYDWFKNALDEERLVPPPMPR